MTGSSNNVIQKFSLYKESLAEISIVNHKKVLEAFKDTNITTEAFNGSTGYGYNDYGRSKLNALYSSIFSTEDAIVSSKFASGTHTLYTALRGLLDFGDNLVSLTGELYDTIEKAIKDKDGIVKKMNVTFDKIDLTMEGRIDLEAIKDPVFKKYKIAVIQRSRGYSTHRSIPVAEIEEAAKAIKKYSPSTILFVDNCYGEFVETREPSDAGADIIAGSLIKNPGGTIAVSGGYIAGRRDLIEKISSAYTVPGIGREIGCEDSTNLRLMFQGIYLAPKIVEECLLTAYYTGLVFSDMGYEISPGLDDTRADIIQSIVFRDKDKLVKFVQTIQEYSPVDNIAVPHPWDMPGYDCQVIMASGSFISGSSLELSADAPLREPYIAYLQGSTSFNYSKIAIDKAAHEISLLE